MWFSQKMNEHIYVFYAFLLFTVKTPKFVCSFFGRIYGTPISFQFYLTFSLCIFITDVSLKEFPKKWISVYLISAMCMIPFLMPYLNKKSRYWFGRKKCPCPTNQRRDQSGYYYITAHQSLVSKQTDKALRTHLLTHIL